jgi:UTP:GlnB (protein PII) uridylyltransferase
LHTLLVSYETYGKDAVQIQLDVTKLDHGVYKLDLICMQQSGVLVQLSQAIEAFVIEIVHTNIVVITSTKVSCTFIVKVNVFTSDSIQSIEN